MPDRNTVGDLARWMLAFESGSLPAAVIEQAKLLILDSIGCALAALGEETVGEILATVDRLGGAPQCSILGRPGKTSVTNAVLANGTLVRVLDFNDFIIGRTANGPMIGGHPSDNIPVALAVGEWQRRSGIEVIAAIVLGYELYNRLKDLMIRTNPWDGTTVSGLVAPAVAGRLLRLEAGPLAHAIALGAMRAATSAIARGGMVSAAKSVSNALVAQSGTLAALLAAEGMTGPLEIFEHPRGLHQVFETGGRLAGLTRPLSDHFSIMDANIKSYPCLATGQTAVAAALKMHEILDGRIDAVDGIEVIMADYPFIERQQADPDRRRPTQREAADHSFYFLTAVGLSDGTFSARQFDDERWRDPRIIDLMDRITLHRDKSWNERAPNSYPCTIRVKTRDGQEHVAEAPYPPGISDGGLDAAVVAAKFDAIARSMPGRVEADAIKKTVMTLERKSTISALMGKLRLVGTGGAKPARSRLAGDR